MSPSTGVIYNDEVKTICRLLDEGDWSWDDVGADTTYYNSASDGRLLLPGHHQRVRPSTLTHKLPQVASPSCIKDPTTPRRPGKRPMSSMCPAIFTDDNGDAVLVIGAAHLALVLLQRRLTQEPPAAPRSPARWP